MRVPSDGGQRGFLILDITEDYLMGSVGANYSFDNFKYQIIRGRIVNMAPLANPNHGTVSGKLYRIFGNYLETLNCNKCKAYHDNNYLRLDLMQKQMDIKLPEECRSDKFVPDVMVICDTSIDTMKGVVGVPALIIEVLSLSTAEYDRKIKKDIYELIGVPEYWIVDPANKLIELYALKDGKYDLIKVHGKYTEEELERIEIDYRELGKTFEVITEFSPHSFPDMTVRIDEVFMGLIE